MAVLAGGLRRAVRRAEVRAALLSPVSGGALGVSAVLAALAFVAEVRGVMAPGAWMAGLGAGVAWVVVTALSRLRPGPLSGEVARGLLLAAFGPEVGRYPETARPVRALIETRVRLAEAVEGAPQHRGAGALVEAGVDAQIVRLVAVAQKAARHRSGVQFHAAMATAAGQRSDAHGPGLLGQRTAAGELVQQAEAERFRLEEEVAALSALVARVTLALARGDGAEIAALAGEAGRMDIV
jgi:hypothetical protein